MGVFSSMDVVFVMPLRRGVFKAAKRVFKAANDTVDAANTLASMKEPGYCLLTKPCLNSDILGRINLHPTMQHVRNVASVALLNKLKGVHTGKTIRCCIQPLGRSDKEKPIIVAYQNVQKTEYHGFVNMDASSPQSVVIDTREGETLHILVAASCMVVWSCHGVYRVTTCSQPSASRMYLRWTVTETGLVAPVTASLVPCPGDIATGLHYATGSPQDTLL